LSDTAVGWSSWRRVGSTAVLAGGAFAGQFIVWKMFGTMATIGVVTFFVAADVWDYYPRHFQQREERLRQSQRRQAERRRNEGTQE
jgi:hypothetical protein